MWRSLLNFAVSAGLVTVALYVLDLRLLAEAILTGNTLQSLFSVVIILVMYIFLAVRWKLMISTVSASPFMESAAVYFKATFLNTFTPANLGGDAYRLVVLKSEVATSGALLKLLLRERLLGFYGYVIVFSLAYVFIAASGGGGPVTAENPYFYGVAVALAAFILPFLVRPLGGRIVAMLRAIIGGDKLTGLEGWVEALAGLLSLRGSLWLMALTFLGILLWVLSIQTIAAGFGLTLPFLQLVAVATLVELVRLVPVTVQGIGLREAAFAYLLSFFGHNPEQCYVVGLAAYLSLSLSIVLCGPIGQILMEMGVRKERG